MNFPSVFRLLIVAIIFALGTPKVDAEFQVSTFRVDVTIPAGHRCMGVLPMKSKDVLDPLEAKGFVLLGSEQPIVVVAVDWCEIRNGAYDQWRESIATSVGTTRERVLVCSLHQHDAPVTDAGAAKLLNEVGLEDELYDEEFHAKTVNRVAAAAKKSLQQAKAITHLGTGQARVKDVASNRRVILENGRVSFGRGSSSGGDKFHSQAPDGEIDPFVKTISFWNGDQCVVALHAYATHPMSRYGQGHVSADFVGLARRRLEQETPGVMQIYASGCSGDVTAGKFNDRSDQAREGLITRLYEGMKQAFESTEKKRFKEVTFRCVPLELEFYAHQDLDPKKLRATLNDDQIRTEDRILAAMGLSSFQRVQSGQAIDFPCVDFGDAKLVLFPGESFVGYQLMAQQMQPDSFVVSMGYGECWPGYIPMNSSFADGFHDKWLWVPAGSENRIRTALQQLLE